MGGGNFTPRRKVTRDGGGSWRTECMSWSISRHMKLWSALSQWFSFNQELTFYTYHYSGLILLSSPCSGATFWELNGNYFPVFPPWSASHEGTMICSKTNWQSKQVMSLNNHSPITHFQKLSLSKAEIKWVLNSNDLRYLPVYFKRRWKDLH